MRLVIAPFIVSALLFFSCSGTRQSTSLQFRDYKIENALTSDTLMTLMLHPYATKMNTTMDEVIGFSNNTLTAKSPESALGNFLADCIKTMAEKKFGTKVDAGFINQGGIRSYIARGNITVGKIFEIMPFDNLVVLQTLKGSVLQQFLDKTASTGGWPVSHGIMLEIKDKKAVNVRINGAPIENEKVYVIANSDYVANGGDDCEMLRKIPKMNIGYLLRNAIIEYVSAFTREKIPIAPVIENRVTYAH